MSNVRQEILENLFPNYEEIKNTLELYSDYELGLIVDICPEAISDISECILQEVQLNIIEILLKSFITNWDKFFSINDNIIADYCFDNEFIKYDITRNAYLINKETVIDICRDLLYNEEEYSINENVDFRNVIIKLNETFPIKFCEI